MKRKKPEIEYNSVMGHNKKNTFIVKIDNNDNSTWQGKIVWADEDKSVRFRSVLELIKLMDEAMMQSQENMDINETSIS